MKLLYQQLCIINLVSLPLREIPSNNGNTNLVSVTPLAGVWIEISKEMAEINKQIESLPLRECGLKFEEMINCFKIMGRLWRCYLKGF